MKREAAPCQSIQRATLAPVERQKTARLAGCRAADLVALDDDRPCAAQAYEVGDRGADCATTADHYALARAHIVLCQARFPNSSSQEDKTDVKISGRHASCNHWR